MSDNHEDVEIGTGATARVFRRSNSRGGMECEKILLPKFRGKAAFELSLRREFEILELARHPLVVSAVTLRSHQDSRWGSYHGLVTHWIEGWKLSEIYSWSSRFSMEFRKLWVGILYRQLSMVVQHLESKGIVHGDLCPENILIGQDGFIRLVDFGSARRLQFDPISNSLDLGHPPYTAVEGRYDVGGDRYSIGKLLENWIPDAHKGEMHELISVLCEKRIWREDFSSAGSSLEPLPLFPFMGLQDARDLRLPETKMSQPGFRLAPKWIAALLPLVLSSWAPRATLSVNTFPLGHAEIVVNGEKQILPLPLDRISLRPGFHKIILTHPSTPEEKQFHVELKSGREYKIFEDFQKVDTLKSWTKASNKM